ncbi:MAG: glycine cleavage system protein GcvH [Chloroflexota bacterium]
MPAPKDLKFTKTHEWVRIDGDVATIGLSDHAQGELGDITYLELPDVGSAISADKALGVVESVKAASDLYAPLDGEVIERNETAVESPELVNQSPYGDAWLVKIKIKNADQLAKLMGSDEYDTFAANAAH